MEGSINLQPLEVIISKRNPGNTYKQRVANRDEFERKFVDLCRANISEVDIKQLGWTLEFEKLALENSMEKTPKLYYEYMFPRVWNKNG